MEPILQDKEVCYPVVPTLSPHFYRVFLIFTMAAVNFREFP